MIGLDTNVLVRYIVQDDKKQAEKASRIIEDLSPQSCGFITGITLCELNWVLKSAYKVGKAKRLLVLNDILSTAVFEIENLSCSVKALRAYEDGKADFSDYLIAELSYEAGCTFVFTFDSAALKNERFKCP